MKTTVRLLAGTCALILVACGTDSNTLGSTKAGFEAQRGRCGPEFKVDKPGPRSVECPKGEVLEQICVKAGPECYCNDVNPGCYTFDGIGTSSGGVLGGGTGPDCKDISHTEYDCEPATPKCQEGRTECPMGDECAKGELCVEGCCEPVPPAVCPPDQTPCETDKDCRADPEICVKGCCVPAK
jgi:hypothetical protein